MVGYPVNGSGGDCKSPAYGSGGSIPSPTTNFLKQLTGDRREI